MPEGLNKLQHPAPIKQQHSPTTYAIPTCGAKMQYADDDNDDEQPVLPDNEIK